MNDIDRTWFAALLTAWSVTAVLAGIAALITGTWDPLVATAIVIPMSAVILAVAGPIYGLFERLLGGGK